MRDRDKHIVFLLFIISLSCLSNTLVEGHGVNLQFPSRPYFVDPTPNDDAVIKCPVGQTTTWTYKAVTKNSKDDVYIFSVNRPHGLQISKQNGTNPATVSVSWKPKSNQIGTYKILVAVTNVDFILFWDTLSITLVVEPHPCGNGELKKGCNSKKENCCQCDPGWDPSSYCYECLPNYYGYNCEPDPPCDHGTVNSGRTGNGKCVCDFGWTGDACDIALPPRCDPNAKSRVITSSSSSYNYINPYDMLVYLEPGNPNLQVPLTLSQYYELPKLDIYLLVDTNVKSWRYIDDLIRYVDHLMFKFACYNKNTKFGLGLFSDSPTKGFDYQHVYTIGSMVKNGFKKSTFTYSTQSTQNSLTALNLASVNNVGWRTSSYRSIVLITDDDCGALNATVVGGTHNNLVNSYIMPTIISMGSKIPNWSQFVSQNGFGITNVTTVFGYDWVYKGYYSVLNSFRQVSPEVVGDSRHFLPSVPANFQIPRYSSKPITIPIDLQLPAQLDSPQDVVFGISVPGYGLTNIKIQFNTPPTAAPLAYNETDYDPIEFTLPVTDADNDVLTVVFQYPDNRVYIYDAQNNSIQPGVEYPASTQFVFVPPRDASYPVVIQYQVDDGCSDASSTLTVDITHTNNPPSALSLFIAREDYVSFEFQLPVSDPDNNPLHVAFTSGNANQYLTVNGQPVQVNQYYTSDTKFTLNWQAPLTELSFDYQVTDNELYASNIVTVKLYNNPPVANPVNLIVPNDGPMTFQVSVSDPDGDAITVSFINIPSYAVIGLVDGTRVVEGQQYPPNSVFTYTPTKGNPLFVEYEVTDGHFISQSYVSIHVDNYAPFTDPINLTYDVRNPNVNFTIPAWDPDTTDQLSVVFTDFVPVNGGFIFFNGQPCQSGVQYPFASNLTTIFTFQAYPAVEGISEYTANFRVYDPYNAFAYSTFNATAANLAPQSDPVVLTAGSIQPITFKFQGVDPEGDIIYYAFDLPVNGTLSTSGQAVVAGTYYNQQTEFLYTPSQSTDRFNYYYKDNYHPAQQSYVVFRINQSPVAPSQTFFIQNYTDFTFTLSSVYDPDTPTNQLQVKVLGVVPQQLPLSVNGQPYDSDTVYRITDQYTLTPIVTSQAVAFSISDGFATVYTTVNVSMFNTPPSVTNLPSLDVKNFNPISISFANYTSDAQGQPITFYQFDNIISDNYAFIVASTGLPVDPTYPYPISTVFTFVPKKVWGTVVLKAYVTDGYLRQSTPMSLSITFSNTPPSSMNMDLIWKENTPFTFYIPSYDYDDDPYNMTFLSVPIGQYGFNMVYTVSGDQVKANVPVPDAGTLQYTASFTTIGKVSMVFRLNDAYQYADYTLNIDFAPPGLVNGGV